MQVPHAQVTNRINARVGEPFNIVLDGNATTPYRWRLDFGQDKLRLMNEQYIGEEGGGVGAGGTYVFTFVPVAPGRATLRASYTDGAGTRVSARHEFYLDIQS